MNESRIIIYGIHHTPNNKQKQKIKNLKIIKNLERDAYIKILSNSKGIIGNSSCGIIEASRFPIPAVNIGSRQNGRPQSKNIINTTYNKKEISTAIKKILNQKIIPKILNNVVNPYYKKNSSLRIYNLLLKYKKNNDIFKKY